MATPLPVISATGREESSELVDAPIGANERVAIMEAVAHTEGSLGTSGGDDKMEVVPSNEGVSSDKGAEVANKTPEKEVEPEPEWMKHLRSIDIILGGEKTIMLHQEFLIRNNNTDLQILKNTKVGVFIE